MSKKQNSVAYLKMSTKELRSQISESSRTVQLLAITLEEMLLMNCPIEFINIFRAGIKAYLSYHFILVDEYNMRQFRND